MKKWWYSSMFAALTCLAIVAVVAAPDAVASDTEVPEIVPAQATVAPEEIPAQTVVDTEAPGLGLEWTVDVEHKAVVSSATGITCTFSCNDGTGLFYECPDPGLGTCCAQAQPACASHGGLDSGVCKKGRLGLVCTPI